MDDPKSLHRYLYADNDPINMIDFTGKWSSIAPFLVHQRAIDDAGILIAYSENELRILNDMQLEVDGKPYQTPNFAYYHAMRNGDSGQTAGQAQQESNDRVRNLIISARDLKKSNDHDGYLKELGRAMHTIQDSTAPTHHGFQPWYDYFGGKANPDEWEHALPEQIYPRIGSWLVEATDDTVRHFYNTKDPLPRDFFNKYGCDGISTQIKQQIMRFTVPSDNAILFESFFGGLFY
jgi:hypothetical protein